MRPLNMVVMHFMVSRNGVTMPEIKIDKNLADLRLQIQGQAELVDQFKLLA